MRSGTREGLLTVMLIWMNGRRSTCPNPDNLPQETVYRPLLPYRTKCLQGGFLAAPNKVASRKKGTQMEQVINDYISREIIADRAQLPLSNDTPLVEEGILDSLSLLQLVVFLEERFGVTVNEADLLPENFTSVNTICAYLRAREPGRQEAAHG
jgi:acyl carrier protein